MTRTKARALTAVAQSREEVVALIGRIGEIGRQVERAKAEADEAVRQAGEALERAIAQPLAELKDAQARVQGWCEAHRAELTGGRGKTVEFGTGRVAWRSRPPKVSLRGRTKEVVIEACKAMGLHRFVRVEEDLNRQAMLAEPEVARGVAGVAVSSEGEDFVIEPAGLEAGS